MVQNLIREKVFGVPGVDYRAMTFQRLMGYYSCQDEYRADAMGVRVLFATPYRDDAFDSLGRKEAAGFFHWMIMPSKGNSPIFLILALTYFGVEGLWPAMISFLGTAAGAAVPVSVVKRSPHSHQ